MLKRFLQVSIIIIDNIHILSVFKYRNVILFYNHKQIIYFYIIFQLNLEDIVLYKAIPICLSHIRHCQRMEKGEKIAYHYAISNRKVEIMYLKKVSSSLLPFIIRQTDLQCTYEYHIIIFYLNKICFYIK